MQKIDKNYVSPIDRRLAEFDEEHPLSASQKAEKDKAAGIAQLRDGPGTSNEGSSIAWD